MMSPCRTSIHGSKLFLGEMKWGRRRREKEEREREREGGRRCQ
jgi:hypothetical protein